MYIFKKLEMFLNVFFFRLEKMYMFTLENQIIK